MQLAFGGERMRRMKRSDRRRLDGAAQGAARCAARPAHAADDRAAVSVLMGPLVLLALSALVAGSSRAPSSARSSSPASSTRRRCSNFLERQTYSVRTGAGRLRGAAAQVNARRSGGRGRRTISRPRWRAATRRCVEMVSDSANQRAGGRRGADGAAAARLQPRARDAEPGAARRRAGSAASRCEVEERDLASPQTRAAQVTGMLPFFVMMAVLYGALACGARHDRRRARARLARAAADEPGRALALVLGKWGAVAAWPC